jgi:hypothetical protein
MKLMAGELNQLVTVGTDVGLVQQSLADKLLTTGILILLMVLETMLTIQ